MPIDVKMPQLGESVVEGTIGRWLKRPGDTIKRHEPLLEVTTDKVDTEVPSTVEGTVLELLVPEGETVRVGTLIARLAEVGEQPQTQGVQPAPDDRAASTVAPISPLVARLAAEHGLDLSKLHGTGANGRITKKDIEHYLAEHQAPQTASGNGAAQVEGKVTAVEPAQAAAAAGEALQETMEASPTPPSEQHAAAVAAREGDRAMPPAGETPELGPEDELVPISPMRRAIAEHMLRSRRIAPHVTTVMEADLSRVAAHRERLRAEYERQGVRLTFTPYFVQAAVAALRSVPIVNASYRDNGILMHDHINVGVAVAIPDGLIVPVIKDADERSLLGLARTVDDLSERARTRRLQPDDVDGGTFTITNHGMNGSIFAVPIINQPQAAILGVGAIQKRAVVISEGDLDAIAIRLRCYLSLTFDHRLIDGTTADHFLRILKQALEDYSD
ncbi:MAG TPA: dihydrolipoamide acetyltransferase family protein [Herpetosiphonaceae bacterium]|nr:dihydrolipoamide acetyltransferase family protein [Herpetosiphonaceae bacterium]